jgi:hypothetical protein
MAVRINQAVSVGKAAISAKWAPNISSMLHPRLAHHALLSHKVPIIKPIEEGASKV